ncbi:MAG: ATP-binding cassette domain-containing protein [Saprospiraceae bacterium]|nr:ATP-binding cassette domain-containing protein [Saprospiraceae bacterium]
MIVVDIRKRLESAEGPFELVVKCQLTPGRIISFFGKSGVGKTSLLRMLAGLMNPDEGRISVNGKLWFHSEKDINIRPQDRRLGFVMQNGGLFPHLTLEENIVFAQPYGNKDGKAEQLLEDVGLSMLRDEKPHRLSGGQTQLAVLAQTLARKPEVLLLDEPLSALDATMRHQMQTYILKTHNKELLSTILVSHDVREVIKLADEVFLIEQGKVINHGSPKDLFFPNLGKDIYQMTGEVIEIAPYDQPNALLVLVGDKLVKVTSTESEVQKLSIGDLIAMSHQAYQPKIFKI